MEEVLAGNEVCFGNRATVDDGCRADDQDWEHRTMCSNGDPRRWMPLMPPMNSMNVEYSYASDSVTMRKRRAPEATEPPALAASFSRPAYQWPIELRM